MLTLSISLLGHQFIAFVATIGNSALFLYKALVVKPKNFSCITRLIKEIYVSGFLSLVIILVSSLFIGLVLGLQGYNILVRFGAEQALGQLVALSLIRELGPVVSGLLFAGRAGSALAAEIGLMKATEQLASMEMMGVDPLHRIIAPRFWAGQISLPLLAMIFSATAILGGYLVGVDWLGVDSGAFWSNMQASVDFELDVLNGIIKSMVFGFAITWIAVYQGYYAEPTAAGISKATTNTVVFASLVILGLDFFLTAIMFKG